MDRCPPANLTSVSASSTHRPRVCQSARPAPVAAAPGAAARPTSALRLPPNDRFLPSCMPATGRLRVPIARRWPTGLAREADGQVGDGGHVPRPSCGRATATPGPGHAESFAMGGSPDACSVAAPPEPCCDRTVDQRASATAPGTYRGPGAVPVPWRRAAPGRPRPGRARIGRQERGAVGGRPPHRVSCGPGSVEGAKIAHLPRVRAARDCPVRRAGLPRRGALRRSGSRCAAGQPRRIAHLSRRGC